MKVKCINNKAIVSKLTVGKEYEIFGGNEGAWLIKVDNGTKEWMPKYRFEKVVVAYKGWEILKMIDDDELKEGDKYIRNGDNREYTVGGTIEPSIKGFINNTFTLKEKIYVTLYEAARYKKAFKYKDWGHYRCIANVLSKLGTTYTNEEIEEMINEKAWEVEEC